MPIYAYQCKNCGHEVDKRVKREEKDSPSITCSECGYDSFERKLSAPTQIKSKNNSSSCPSGSCGL